MKETYTEAEMITEACEYWRTAYHGMFRAADCTVVQDMGTDPISLQVRHDPSGIKSPLRWHLDGRPMRNVRSRRETRAVQFRLSEETRDKLRQIQSRMGHSSETEALRFTVETAHRLVWALPRTEAEWAAAAKEFIAEESGRATGE